MGRPRKYSWKRIMSGKYGFEFSLLRGFDYDCSDDSIIQQIRNQASTHDRRIKVHTTDTGITVVVKERV